MAKRRARSGCATQYKHNDDVWPTVSSVNYSDKEFQLICGLPTLARYSLVREKHFEP